MVLQAGSFRADASVRGRLDSLRQELAPGLTRELDPTVKLRPEEITSILKQRIEDFDVETNSQRGRHRPADR